MPRPSKHPRRAMQRRNVRRRAAAAGSSLLNEEHTTQHKTGDVLTGSDGLDSSSTSNNKIISGSCRNSRSSRAKRTSNTKTLSAATKGDTGTDTEAETYIDKGKDSDSDSDSDAIVDSGYASDEELPDNIASYYQQLIAQFEADGPTIANHGENTRKMTIPEEKRWNLFCQASKLDPEESLKACKASIYKGYLHWRVKNSRIKKESSILTYWNVLCMVYSEKTACWMDTGVLYDIRNWIPTALTPLFDLDISKKEKSGLYVDDLDLILHHHWVWDKEVFAHERLRVQLALILIIAGATATRPDALIGKLLYKHVEFQLFPPTDRGMRPRLGLIVNLVNVKRSAGKAEPKKFGFHEEDTLLHDPVLHMMALTLADDAFLNELHRPEQIYELMVRPGSDRLRLLWKEEWQDRPIFRDVESANGVQVSLEKALTYSTTRNHLIRLGRAVGYAKKLEFYDIRRGSGKKLNEALTPEERNKAMGHRLGDSSTYVRYYMTNFIDADTQSIVFGSDLQADLVHLMGRLLRHVNAPTELTNQQKFEVHNHPELVEQCQERANIVAEIKLDGYGTCKAAKGTTLGERYTKCQKKINTLRKTLMTKRLESAIKEFHETVHVEEADRQLRGIMPSTVLAPSTIEYELPERAQVARLFSEAADISNRDALHDLRMKLVGTIALLCKRRESPCRRQAKGGHEATAPTPLKDALNPLHSPVPDTILAAHHETSAPESPSAQITQTRSKTKFICPFCRIDHEVGVTQRNKKWRLDSLARHVRGQHLRKRHAPFNCPYDDCSAILGNAGHFANHTARSHGLLFPPAIIQASS